MITAMMMTTMSRKRIRLEEVWKPVLGYEGWYEASSLGYVRRVKSGQGARLGILKPGKDKDGYLQVNLYKNGKCKLRKVHIIICEAFHGPKPAPNSEVNHDNGVKDDNREKNLLWCTSSQNKDHAVKTGLIKTGRNDRRSKEYIFLSPEGEKFEDKGLNEFCRINNLDASAMSAVARGKRPHHKGWRCSFGTH